MPQPAEAKVVPLAEAPERPRVSLCVPFHDEAETLPLLIQALDGFAREQARRRGLRIDAIFVDDGSADGGAAVLEQLAAGGGLAFDLRLLRLSRNFGKEVAL